MQKRYFSFTYDKFLYGYKKERKCVFVAFPFGNAFFIVR